MEAGARKKENRETEQSEGGKNREIGRRDTEVSCPRVVPFCPGVRRGSRKIMVPRKELGGRADWNSPKKFSRSRSDLEFKSAVLPSIPGQEGVPMGSERGEKRIFEKGLFIPSLDHFDPQGSSASRHPERLPEHPGINSFRKDRSTI